MIGEPTVVLSLNTDKVLQQANEGSWVPFADAHWSDNLPNLLQTKIIQSFENAGYVDAVLRPADALDPQFRLIIDIRTFHFQNYNSPLAVIDLVAKIINRDGTIVVKVDRAFCGINSTVCIALETGEFHDQWPRTPESLHPNPPTGGRSSLRAPDARTQGDVGPHARPTGP